jgi:hypothetical protein
VKPQGENKWWQRVWWGLERMNKWCKWLYRHTATNPWVTEPSLQWCTTTGPWATAITTKQVPTRNSFS